MESSGIVKCSFHVMEFGVRMALKAITNTTVVLEATMVSNVIVIVTRTKVLVRKNVLQNMCS